MARLPLVCNEDEAALLQLVLPHQGQTYMTAISKYGGYRPYGHDKYGKPGPRGHDNHYGTDKLDRYTYGEYSPKNPRIISKATHTCPTRRRNIMILMGRAKGLHMATMPVRNPRTTRRKTRTRPTERNNIYTQTTKMRPPSPKPMFPNHSQM